jgi:hypothetical protein
VDSETSAGSFATRVERLAGGVIIIDVVDSDVLRDEQQEQEENGKDEEDQTDVGAAAKLERRTPVMSHVYNTYTLYTAQMLRSLNQAT